MTSELFQIVDSHEPVSLVEILIFEKKIGKNFPDSYKNFLLKYNGGHPKFNVFSYQINGGFLESAVHYFLGLTDDDSDSLEENLAAYQGRLPNDCFPIAYDANGNLILLALEGANREKVYFWDHENEVDEGEEPDYRNVYLIANSFDEFLANLQDESVLMTR
jgi:hypothetical protein